MFERNNWVWLLLALLLLALALAVPVGGRKGSLQGEQTFSGTVEAVNRRQCEICHAEELSITLQAGARLLEVRLGPAAFFAERNFQLSSGDAVEISGVEFRERGRDVVRANEARKAGESLLLRGKHGRPVWVGARGRTCPVCGN